MIRTGVAAALAACSHEPVLGWTSLADLPAAVSNNAVTALARDDGGCTLVSAGGIDSTRSGTGIHGHSWMFEDGWVALPDLPGPPRIAASAVSLRGRAYVLGGYSVATDGAETTHAEMYALDPQTRSWVESPPLPVAIDDAVAVAWRDRWIVVVSGWSVSAPTATVQLFDAEQNAWLIGTPVQGTPVFGHAGALVGDDLIVIDGVGVGPRRGFQIVHQTWRARLDPAAPETIAWTQLPDHPGPARYRAAAGAADEVLGFHGGTAEPYNFDGLTYATGSPAIPLADTLWFDRETGTWSETSHAKPEPSMDHRGLVGCGDDRVYTIGGMVAGPEVVASTWRLTGQ